MTRSLALLLLCTTCVGRSSLLTDRHGDDQRGDNHQQAGDDVETTGVFTRMVLPNTGQANRVSVSPLNPTRVFLGVGEALSFLSSDSGVSWRGCAPEEYESIATDAAEAGTLWLGGPSDVWVSRDECFSWTATGLGRETRALLSLPGGDLIAGTEDGLHRWSTGTWTPVATALDGQEVWSLASDSTGQHVYAGSESTDLVASHDGGTTWSAASVASSGILDLAVEPTNPATVWAQTWTGLYRSLDSGATFSMRWTSGRTTVTVDQSGDVWSAADVGFYRSTDGGASWSVDQRTPEMQQGTVNQLRADPSGRLWVALESGLFVLSPTGAWTTASASIDAIDARRVHVDAEGWIYVASPAGALRSADDGATWGYLLNGVEPIAESSAVTTLPNNPSVVLLAAEDLFRSSDRGASFSLSRAHSSSIWFTVVECVPTMCVAATANRVETSTDGGVSWTTANPVTSWTWGVLIDPGPPRRILIGANSGVFYSEDDGVTFTPSDMVGGVRAVARVPGGPYLAGSDYGLYASLDPAGPWVATSLTDDVSDLLAGPDGIIAATEAGVFWTADHVGTWTLIPGLEDRGPRALARAGDDLLVGCNDRGLYRTPWPL